MKTTTPLAKKHYNEVSKIIFLRRMVNKHFVLPGYTVGSSSKTKESDQAGLIRVVPFWKSHCVTFMPYDRVVQRSIIIRDNMLH